MIIKSSIVGRFTWEKSEQFNDILWCHHWFSQEMTSDEPGGGGGYSQTLPIRVSAAQRGRDFEAPNLERGIHFRGVC